MTKLPQQSVNYYTPSDIYSFEVDNRPLYDLSANIDSINTGLSQLGFYGEYTANSDFEPSGGFTPLTCVYVGTNSQLYPIDVSVSSAILDYTKYPIVLVLEKLTSGIYRTIAFSASLVIPNLYTKFLTSSVGSAVKVGPGGSLVDEVTFDLSYASYGYQNLIVGKVLTTTSISFGGNQVSTLTDNRFIAKNKIESTTGLITFLRNLQDSNIATRVIASNTASSPYPFIEYQAALGDFADYSQQRQPIPIYFTYKSLSVNSTNGSFIVPASQSLNEIHFASPSISSSTEVYDKYRTAGVNISSLLSYAESYLLHAKQLSDSLKETSQNISTSLLFDNSTNTQTVIGFNANVYDIGTALDSTYSYPNKLLLNLTTANLKGILFGSYATTFGSYIGYTADNNTSVVDDIYKDLSMDVPAIKNSGSLLLHSKSSDTTTHYSNIFLVADGSIALSASDGVFYSNVPSKDYELTNKLYVDLSVLSASNTAKTKIPLAGSTADIPVTGSIYFDVKASEDPVTVLNFDTLNRTLIKSSNEVEFLSLTTDDYQVVRGATPVDTDGNTNDLTTRSYVIDKINSSVSGAIGNNFVTVTGSEQVIDSFKTFSRTVTIKNIAPLDMYSDNADEITITSDAPVIHFSSNGTASKVKLKTSPTEDSDEDNIVVTKKWLEDYIDSKLGAFSPCYGTWADTSTYAKISVAGTYNNWYDVTGGTAPSMQMNFLSYFTIAGQGVWKYTYDTPGIFLVTVQDGRWNGTGAAANGGIFTTQTAIVVNNIVMARNIHQDDTDGSSVNSLVGSSCSVVVKLNKNDTIFIASQESDHASASIAKIG